MAKESDKELKYQVPKHTSFVGSIIKVWIADCMQPRTWLST